MLIVPAKLCSPFPVVRRGKKNFVFILIFPIKYSFFFIQKQKKNSKELKMVQLFNLEVLEKTLQDEQAKCDEKKIKQIKTF